ncbi:MAG: hypothetical protein KAT15_06835, partial [Bacteroidales bacterium]|nr:hypothetical protein [Bacteroidales bacterium]
MIKSLKRLNKTLNKIPDRFFNVAFLIFIVISALQYLLFKYSPSLDGPQHLYNAYVLKDLVLNRGIIPDYLAINPSPVGYWTTQLVLSFFTMVLPPWLAEKLILLIYVATFALAYRYFCRSSEDDTNRVALFLIFPFIFSYYILTGNYAFGFGIVLFFFCFGFWNQISSNVKVVPAIKLSILLLLLYFTHVVIFTFFVFSFAIYYLLESVIDLHPGNNQRLSAREVGIRTLFTLAAFIPPAIPWFISTRSVISLQASLATQAKSAQVLLDHLFRIRPLIGFHHGIESVATIPLFLLLMLVLVTILSGSLYRLDRGIVKSRELLFRKSNLYLVVAAAFMLLYMLNPDQFMAGNLTARAGLFFFLLLIMWIPFNRLPGLLNLLMAVVIAFTVIYNQAIMPQFYTSQNEFIKELQELDKYMEEGATVWPLKESDNWLHKHFQLYIGLRKHSVNLENPQCYGPFPIIWNQDELPAMFAGDQQLKFYGTD